MIRTVERFQTADGRLFETEEKALEHVADQCRQVLDNQLQVLQVSGKLSATDRFRIVMALIPDAETGYEITKALLASFTEDAR